MSYLTKINKETNKVVDRKLIHLGNVPIMILSSLDPIRKMSPNERFKAGVSEVDPGGYFIYNGIPKA